MCFVLGNARFVLQVTSLLVLFPHLVNAFCRELMVRGCGGGGVRARALVFYQFLCLQSKYEQLVVAEGIFSLSAALPQLMQSKESKCFFNMLA